MNIALFKKLDDTSGIFQPTLHAYFSSPLTNAAGLFAKSEYDTSSIAEEINPQNINFNCDEIIDGSGMFLYQTGLASVELDFPKLKIAQDMFRGCRTLEYLECDFSSLTGDDVYFDDISMKSTASMFLDCGALETINCDFASLKNGDFLFETSNNLTNLNCNLNSLESANGFCVNGKLTIESVINIANSIKESASVSKPTIGIGIGCSSSNINEPAENGISFMDAINLIKDRGWTVYYKCSGPSTLNLDDSSIIYCKKELANETIATHKDGENNFYIIYTADGVVGDSENKWQVFSSIDEAEQTWQLSKISK